MSEIKYCAVCKAGALISFKEKFYCVDHGREAVYEFRCSTPSDINEHLSLLRLLAERCKHVTEFGLRWGNGSTAAFLAAQPETLISWDIDPESVVSREVMDLIVLRGKTSFQPRVGDTLKITTEPTDLLFIDTYHTGRHLLSELERHVDPKNAPVRKYLAFHDTHLFGLVGEDGKPPGLRTAIRQFQKYFAFPLWKLAKHPTTGELLDLENNSGLVVLEHVCAEGHSPERTKGRCQWCGHLVEGP